MHAHQQFQARLIDASRPAREQDPEEMEPCPACAGDPTRRAECGRCDGLGAVLRPGPEEFARGGEPDWLLATAEAIGAVAGIERHGVQGWMALAGIDRVDADLAAEIEVLQGELSALEMAERRADAAEARRSRASQG